VQQPSSQPQPESQPQPSALLLQPNNNKRKAMEEGLSPDRTRPRYNGITTMV
jgi:two-component response regulator (ARR-A family)